MKTRDNHQELCFDAEKEAIRKRAQAGAVDVLKHCWELIWVLSYAVHDNFQLSAKAHPETCPLCFVPILSVEDFGARPA